MYICKTKGNKATTIKHLEDMNFDINNLGKADTNYLIYSMGEQVVIWDYRFNDEDYTVCATFSIETKQVDDSFSHEFGIEEDSHLEVSKVYLNRLEMFSDFSSKENVEIEIFDEEIKKQIVDVLKDFEVC